MNSRMKQKIDRAAAVLKEYGAKEVYVFGSAVEGRFTQHSDIDLAVIGLPPAKFFIAMSCAQKIIDRPIDLIDLDDGSNFSEYLKNEGILLHV